MYNAFISYSHAADGKLAPAVQSALERFAKPWFKKRNLNIFRDEASLSASPHLWGNIQKGLDQSEYMIYMASPVSASSKWVQKEIEYWLAHKSIDKLLIVLTDGEISWDDKNKSFFNADTNSLPAILENKFTEDAFYVDLRHLKTHNDLSLQNPLFKKQILRLAAQVHGKEPKDLASEEVTVHRKMIRVRNAAIAILIFLFIAACGATWFANKNAIEATMQKKTALRERDIARANYLRSEAKSVLATDPTLALRLYEQALLLYNDSAIKKEALEVYQENYFYKIIENKEALGIRSIAFSPDGKSVLMGGENLDFNAFGGESARLRGLDGKLLKEFEGHSSHINSVIFSPDGKKILTGSDDSTARLWGLNGNTILKFIGHSGSIRSVAFSITGDSILTGSDDSTARLWGPDGKMIQAFKKHTSGISSVAFAPDGKTILSGSEDWTARLWDLKGNVLHVFKEHSADVTSVAFSPDGKTILLGSEDSTASLWDLKGNPLQKFKGRSGEITSVAFSPDGKTILTGSSNYSAQLWRVDGRFLKEFKGHSMAVSAVAFSPNGKSILTCSWDVRLWNIEVNMIMECEGHSGHFNSVAFSPKGNTILTGSNDSVARLLDLTGRILKEFKGHSSGITSVAFSPDGEKIITGSGDSTARLWDLKGNTIQEFKGHSSAITSVAFAPEGKTILTGSKDQSARLWGIDDGNMIAEINWEYEIKVVAFSNDTTGERMILTASEHSICLWKRDATFIGDFLVHTSHLYSAAFSPDGKKILTGSNNDTARLWDLSGNLLQKFSRPADVFTAIASVAFSRDGRKILTGGQDRTAQLLDLDGNILREYKGHSDAILTVAFSPDGKSILTGTMDGTIRLWNTMTLPEFLKSDKIEPLSEEQKKRYGIK